MATTRKLKLTDLRAAILNFVALNQSGGITAEEVVEGVAGLKSLKSEPLFPRDQVLKQFNLLVREGCLNHFVQMSAQQDMLRYRAEVDVKFNRRELFRARRRHRGGPGPAPAEIDMLFALKKKIEIATLDWVCNQPSPAGHGKGSLFEHFGYSPVSIVDQEIAVSRTTGDLIITCQYKEPTLFQDWIRTVVRSFREVEDTHTTIIRNSSAVGATPEGETQAWEAASDHQAPNGSKNGKALKVEPTNSSPVQQAILATVSFLQSNGLTRDDVSRIVASLHERDRSKVTPQIAKLLAGGRLRQHVQLGVRHGIYPYRAAIDVKLDRREAFEALEDPNNPLNERQVLSDLADRIRTGTEDWLQYRTSRAHQYESGMKGIHAQLPVVAINNVLEVVSRPNGDLTLIVQHMDQHRFNDWIRDVVRSFRLVLDTHTTTIHYSNRRGERTGEDKHELEAVTWLAENLKAAG